MTAPRLLLRRLAFSTTHPQSSSLSTRPSGLFSALSQCLKTSTVARTSFQACTLRAYATQRGRPKKGVTSSSSSKKPAKKPAPKRKQKAKSIPAKKPAKKKRTVKRKTDEQIISAKVRALRQVALLDVPKQRPTTVWTIYNQQHIGKGAPVTDQVRQNGREYRNLSVTQRESLNQTAINNRALNTRTYSDWVRSHTPDQIRLANNARARLNRLAGQRHSTGYRFTKRYTLLKDDRQLKRPKSGFMQFMADRWATGEFAGVKVQEASKTMTQDWKNLSESDRKQYNDDAFARKEVYLTESAELYPSIAEKQQRDRAAMERRNARGRSETLGR
ncbi:MAG: hypothetical protein Q9162_004760 [Coniocarpon cinnabarinum]